jgi:outer membrane lipoprotein LolB
LRRAGQPEPCALPRLGSLLAVFVAACATLPPAPGAGTNYSGRFSLVVDGIDRHETDSGRFTLTVDGRDVTVDLSTPFGTTVARVQSGPDGARVSVPSGGGVRSEWGPDAQALSLKVLGWSLPVTGIGDWIEGRPPAGRIASSRPMAGRHGWNRTAGPSGSSRPRPAAVPAGST